MDTAREVDPPTMLLVIERIARADGAAGWCTMIASTTSLLSHYVEPSHARAIWGDPSVLALDTLSTPDRKLFDALSSHPALPSAADQSRTLPEPHPSWHIALGEAWRARYAT
jgi:hypothetical protein